VEKLCRLFMNAWRRLGLRWEMIPRTFMEPDTQTFVKWLSIDYLERCRIFDNRFFGVYFHCFWSSDADGLHDHPFPFVTIPLTIGYGEEVLGAAPTWRPPLRPIVHGSEAFHRITLAPKSEGRVFTLFLRGPRWKGKRWGFLAEGVENTFEVRYNQRKVRA
jgi:hypothetical protein